MRPEDLPSRVPVSEAAIDELVTDVLHQTPDVYGLSAETQLLVMSVIRKGVEAGLDSRAYGAPFKSDQDRAHIVEEALSEAGIAPTNPYFTYQGARSVAKKAVELTEAMLTDPDSDADNWM